MHENVKNFRPEVLSGPAYFRMVVTDKDGNPYVFNPYKLSIDGTDIFGKTDLCGLVEEIVPRSAKMGILSIIPNNFGGPRTKKTWHFSFE